MQLFDPNKELRGVMVDYPGGRKRVRVVVRDSDSENYQTFEINDPRPTKTPMMAMGVGLKQDTAHDLRPEIEERLRDQVSQRLGIKKEHVSIPKHVIVKME